MGRMSSGNLGNRYIFPLAFPRGDNLTLGLAEFPTVIAQVINDLASPLVGLLVVVKGSIGLDDTVTELTEADDELAAVAVVAHSYIIGQGADKIKGYARKPPRNIALMGLLG